MPTDAGERWLIWAIVALAALLRLPTIFFEAFHHPDEVWQYLEPAYGIVTGRSVVTWEYREGMRSWLVPDLFTLPIWVGKAITPTGQLHLPLARLLAVLLSLAIVASGTAIALRISRLHGVVAGLVLATSFELIYFSARTLSETLSTALMFPAAWLLLPHDRRSARRVLVGGLLLGLAVSVRLQLAPAAALLALACCRFEWRTWLALVGGGLLGLGVDVAADALHGAPPLGWMLSNFQLNVVENRSASYGVEPPWWYATNQLRTWGLAAVPMLVLSVAGARRQPILLLVAIVNIAAHSVIPHKEYRFVFLSVALLILLAAIGTADLILYLRARWPRQRRRITAAVAIFWLGCSVATAAGGAAEGHWSSNKRSIALMRAAHAAPACGLAFYKPEANRLVAYLYYDRPTPIFYLEGPDEARALAASYNLVVTAPRFAREIGSGYRQIGCYGAKTADDGRCLYARAGACAESADRRFDVNAVLVRRGE